jgi:hypothetical protein
VADDGMAHCAYRGVVEREPLRVPQNLSMDQAIR